MNRLILKIRGSIEIVFSLTRFKKSISILHIKILLFDLIFSFLMIFSGVLGLRHGIINVTRNLPLQVSAKKTKIIRDVSLVWISLI